MIMRVLLGLYCGSKNIKILIDLLVALLVFAHFWIPSSRMNLARTFPRCHALPSAFDPVAA